jgi:hypothetical protein
LAFNAKCSPAAATPRRFGLHADGFDLNEPQTKRSNAMKRFISQRLFALLLSAIGVLTLVAPAQAVQRAYVSRGTAHFTGPNTFEGAGTATHLARYAEEGTVQFSPTADPTVSHLEASATYTAANGDQIYATFSGQLNGVTGAIIATVTYVGGTGRYANASGTASLAGQLLPSGTIEVAIKGTINY